MEPAGANANFDLAVQALAWRLVWAVLALGLYQLTAHLFVGLLDGKVLDPQGVPVPAAHVSLVKAAGNTIRAVNSDEQGNFGFADIDPGSYQLVAEPSSLVYVVSNVAVSGAQQ